MKTPREKYQNDDHYRVLVDTLCSYIHSCYYTPSELREAAILAGILYEENRIYTRHLPLIPKHIEKALDILYKWSDKGETSGDNRD